MSKNDNQIKRILENEYNRNQKFERFHIAMLPNSRVVASVTGGTNKFIDEYKMGGGKWEFKTTRNHLLRMIEDLEKGFSWRTVREVWL